MNTSQIKSFAIEARKLLKTGVVNRIDALGFDADGNPRFGLPQRIEGATVYAGAIHDTSFYDAWMSLYEHIRAKGIKETYEEAAYTWFNRFMAIRIMQKNRFIEPVLAYANEETRVPRIVAEARAGRIMCASMPEFDRNALSDLLLDDSRTEDQFAILIENFCKSNAVLFNCFGGIEKWVSLLLPSGMLAPGGFIDLLNHTDYITDEDFTKSELIGWLYQFYIAEKKDEVFAAFKKNVKAGADEIPAATQIFTPNWIVKYMVQNTLGRIYLDNNRDSRLGDGMRYLVGEPTLTEAALKIRDLEDYKFLDPGCGSGHILVEAFDTLFAMYKEEGYSTREAVENILSRNLIGIDIDTRAKQLATFSLLFKAMQKDIVFADCHIMPRVLDMPIPFFRYYHEPLEDFFPHYFVGCSETVNKECCKAFALLEKADILGSIMRFDMISEDTRAIIERRTKEWEQQEAIPEAIREALPSMRLILALTDKYTCVVANPPYMGASNMNAELSSYVKSKYPEGKADLFAVFMYVAMDILKKDGKMGMINMQSWMFLSSFEDLRKTFMTNYHVDNMLHLGPRTFDELSGDVVQNTAFVFTNTVPTEDSVGNYYRLVGGRSCSDKELIFLSNDGLFSNIPQTNFSIIPGCPIGYWISERMVECFRENKTLAQIADLRSGISTGDNDRFYRFWYEVSNSDISNSAEKTPFNSDYRWFKIIRGGTFRRWYGCRDNVINLGNSCHDISTSGLNHRLRTASYYNKFGVTWNRIGSTKPTIRVKGPEVNFGENSPCMFLDNEMDAYYLIGLLNSTVVNAAISIINPTLSFQSTDLEKLPIIINRNESNCIVGAVKDNISITKKDWDAHETSWDFKTNELIALKDEVFMSINGEKQNIPTLLKEVLEDYKSKWARLFNQLHSNEEELNRQFIEIYGLQDELTPDVPLDEITILQQGEISIENNEIVWHYDVIIKQLISYAVGCWLGRYRLDKPGLHIAHPNPTSDEVCTYQYNGQDFEIDDDGIIPFLSRDAYFEDNCYNRIVDFVRIVFGEEHLAENLNFIERCLGKTIEAYLVKDFYKDHLKMYQNRPIYWMFSSPKGAFKCLVYMHRMTPYTAELVRSEYLLKHIDNLRADITRNDARTDLSSAEMRTLEKKRKDLEECLEYHDRLHVKADEQIAFDLDDGVAVNYLKFGNVLADANIKEKKEKE